MLGPIAGVMIADYFIVRGMRLEVADLYGRNGIYEYSGGFNRRAVSALAAGIAAAPLGLVVPAVRWLYDYAWFAGFAVSGTVYVGWMKP